MSENETRVALVTGGTQGIGSGITRRLALDGAKVVTGCINPPSVVEPFVAKLKEEDGVEIDSRYANFANPADCQKIIDDIVRDYGRIDYLVNNAGIVRDRTALKMQLLDFDQVMKTNLYGPFFLIKAALPHFLEAGFGRVVNISSFVAETGRIGQSNYAAAKAGLIGMSKTLALETATKGVTVNCIIPGAIKTEMTAKLPEDILQAVIDTVPMGEMGTPEDIASGVAFFCRDDARYITGAVLPVTGGLLMM
ncbi:MAG: 3-oxoacyl-ACP reductase [Micrococcales bacterium]|nr:MAG: 3-oxoacyl-ACP reductase [Micrococcales bacterium]PIE27748.1 MAG: 3-oxoacyl-ACP reductase [Micrococcales bacterium]